jgi:hypothetical protein
MTTELFLTRLLDNSIWFIFIACTGLLLTNKNNYHSDKGVLFVALFCLLTIWLLVGLIYLNKLVVIQGSNPTENRQRIIQLINDKFPKLKLDNSGQTIIRYDLKTGLFNWGRRITIIFKDENIFVNITTFGRFDIKSPFHSIFHYWTLKRIGRQLQDENNSR